MYFPTTHWSLLAKATLNGETEARSALDELCRRYWKPLNQFIRARNYSQAEAQDLTQEFLLHLMEHGTFRRSDPFRGKFRSFLLGALANFLSHERERRLAQKRGGEVPHLSIDTLGAEQQLSDPRLQNEEVAAFDRAWALTIVRAALDHVERDYVAAGKAELFIILRGFLPGVGPATHYEEAATRAGMSIAALNSEVHRLRKQFRERLCAEVTGTVSAPHELDEELSHLYRVLIDRGTDFGPGPKVRPEKT